MPVFEPIKQDLDDLTDIHLKRLQKDLGVSRIMAKLLVNRGLIDPRQAALFLAPSLKQLHDPFRLDGMDKAVGRIKKAVAGGEHFVIYGDYDVDGITAASMLYIFLTDLGAHAQVYIPDRHVEGYGLNVDAIQSIAKTGADIIITVDCGITAIEEVALANSLGMDVIVTDHHICARQLPGAFAIISPTLKGSDYPFNGLSGVGVAAKLLQALGGLEVVQQYLDIIAIGTVADMVPLFDENRILVAKGIEKMMEQPWPGVEALIRISGIENNRIDAGKVGFCLAPRLNAAGRMSSAYEGIRLLTCKSLEQALPIAQELDHKNKLRQQTETQLVNDVKLRVDKELTLCNDRIIVMEGEGWHKGVIGIAASRVANYYNRPCMLISVQDGKGIGSARGILGFDVYDALSRTRHLFIRMGGHVAAAGFLIAEHNIPALKESMLKYAGRVVTDSLLMPKATYDDMLVSQDIKPELLEDIERLAPFGMGNPCPRFLFAGITLEDCRVVGKESQHIKFSLGKDQRIWDGVGFGLGYMMDSLTLDTEMDALAELKNNEWMGISRIQLMVRAFKRVIACPKHIESVIAPFYLKFFDVFLSEVMYNVNNMSLCEIEQETVFPRLSVDEFLHSLNGSCVGHLMLANTKEGGRQLLALLVAHGIADNVAVSYGNVNDLGRNALVLAPDIRRLPLRHYNKIYLLEEEEGLQPSIFFNQEITTKVSIVKGCATSIQTKIDLLKVFEMNRVKLADFYRWVKSKPSARCIWPDVMVLSDEFNRTSGKEMNGFQISMAIEVFKELEFFIIDRGHKYIRIKCVKSPRSRGLDESRLYNYYEKWSRRLFLMNDGGQENGFETENTSNT